MLTGIVQQILCLRRDIVRQPGHTVDMEIDGVEERARAKWPELFAKPRDPMPLFDGKEAAA